MSYQQHHTMAESLLAQVESAKPTEISDIFRKAAQSEEMALNALPLGDELIPTTLVETVRLYWKARFYFSAASVWKSWQHYDLPDWAIDQVQAVLKNQH